MQSYESRGIPDMIWIKQSGDLPDFYGTWYTSKSFNPFVLEDYSHLAVYHA